MSTVKAVLGDGQPLTAAITKDAAADLDLAPGDPVMLIIKSTEVIVATGIASDGPLAKDSHATQRPQPAQCHR